MRHLSVKLKHFNFVFKDTTAGEKYYKDDLLADSNVNSNCKNMLISSTLKKYEMCNCT